MTNEEKVIAFENAADDKRIASVENAANANIAGIEKTYDAMIGASDAFFADQKAAVEAWGEAQKRIQNEQTQFTIDKIEQQKAQAEKDYQKEQSASYADWQKQSQAHGVNAEQMAAQGMTKSGYSESAQVAMYNTYQNRVATARESFVQIKLNYDNSITEAKLQNNATIAEIAFETMQKGYEISLQGFQYKNTLLTEKANQITNAKNTAWGQYLDVLGLIQQEEELAWNKDKFSQELAWDKEKLGQELAWDKEKLESQQKYDREQAEIDRQHEIDMQEDRQTHEQAEAILQRAHELAKIDKQHANDLAILAEKLKNDKELTAYEQSLYEALIDPDGTGTGSTGTGSTGTGSTGTTKPADDNGGGKKSEDLYGYTIVKDPAKVTNESGRNWVNVPGLGYMMWGQLQSKVEAGVVSATKNGAGKTTYTYEGESESREEFDASKKNATYIDGLIKKGYITKQTVNGKTKYYWTKLGKQMQNSI
jgi:hypothetical protein